MRKLVIPIFVLGLAVSLCGIAWAGSGPGDNPPAPATDKAATQPAANLPDAPTPTTTSAPAAASATPAVESELAELRALLHAQAAEIEAQRKELADLKAKLGDVKEEAVDAAVSAAVPAATAAIAPNGSTVLTGGGADESPLAIHFKGITLTPGGFTAAETVYRNRATSSDINTSLSAVPYAGSDMAHISEFNFSGRQSRITLKMEGKISSATIGGYYEGDFLGAGTTSNNNESNSYIFRQRQAWGSIAFNNNWFVSGGQMWSLVTEQKEGLQNRTSSGAENANVPLTIDAQYTSGLSWARQYAFRVADSFFDKKFSLGFSVEGSQTKLTQHGGNANFVVQAPGAQGGTFNFVSSVGTATALCTGVTVTQGPPVTVTCTTSNIQGPASQNYTLNPAPDFVFKAALDPGWGHYELIGVVREFRDRIYPCAVGVSAADPCPINTAITADSAIGASNDSRAGGFGVFNLRVPLFAKHVDFGFHALYGDGVGRYGTVGLADATVRPDGTLAPIRGGQGLGTIEWHVNKKLDIYMYGGGEYDARAAYLTAFGTNAPVPGIKAPATISTGVGYGSPTLNDSGCTASTGSAANGLPVEQLPSTTSVGLPTGSPPGSCTADPRTLIEGTIGFWHRLWQGDRGRIQWGAQYSYVELEAWSGTTGSATATSTQFHPHTNDNMFFTSFRYYLP